MLHRVLQPNRAFRARGTAMRACVTGASGADIGAAAALDRETVRVPSSDMSACHRPGAKSRFAARPRDIGYGMITFASCADSDPAAKYTMAQWPISISPWAQSGVMGDNDGGPVSRTGPGILRLEL